LIFEQQQKSDQPVVGFSLFCGLSLDRESRNRFKER
jgi:hypothetical protein